MFGQRPGIFLNRNSAVSDFGIDEIELSLHGMKSGGCEFAVFHVLVKYRPSELDPNVSEN